jgi:hypothetical protein
VATPVGFYSLNILLSTILFVIIFVTGSAWTEAASQQIQGKKNSWKMLVFAGVITVVTLAFSIAFGELGRVNRNKNVDVQGLLTSSLAQIAPSPMPPLAPASVFTPGTTTSYAGGGGGAGAAGAGGSDDGLLTARRQLLLGGGHVPAPITAPGSSSVMGSSKLNDVMFYGLVRSDGTSGGATVKAALPSQSHATYATAPAPRALSLPASSHPLSAEEETRYAQALMGGG